jgi:hypothetical protein
MESENMPESTQEELQKKMSAALIKIGKGLNEFSEEEVPAREMATGLAIVGLGMAVCAAAANDEATAKIVNNMVDQVMPDAQNLASASDVLKYSSLFHSINFLGLAAAVETHPRRKGKSLKISTHVLPAISEALVKIGEKINPEPEGEQK